MSRGKIIVVNNFEEPSDSEESNVVISGTWMRETEYLIRFLVCRRHLKTPGPVHFCLSFGKDAESDSYPLKLDVSSKNIFLFCFVFVLFLFVYYYFCFAMTVACE